VSPMTIGWTVLACVFGGALLGMGWRLILPEHHLSSASKDVIKLGMGLTARMSALVLALLIASAKTSYDTQRNELTQLFANVVLLDRVLAHYGPETKDLRNQLRLTVMHLVEQLWPKNNPGTTNGRPPPAGGEIIYDKIGELSPQNEAQRSLRAQAQKMSVDLAHTRWLMFEQSDSSIPMPFLVLLVFWITAIFISFGLFAPPNATVIATLFLCALSVSGAIFLILELDRPFAGVVHISDAPLRNAIAHLGQ
jgi:hypothetical protein